MKRVLCLNSVGVLFYQSALIVHKDSDVRPAQVLLKVKRAIFVLKLS